MRDLRAAFEESVWKGDGKCMIPGIALSVSCLSIGWRSGTTFVQNPGLACHVTMIVRRPASQRCIEMVSPPTLRLVGSLIVE